VRAETILNESERALTGELDRLRDDVIAQQAERFIVVLQGRRSISKRYSQLPAQWRGREANGPDESH
jgi:hypothetical protein